MKDIRFTGPDGGPGFLTVSDDDNDYEIEVRGKRYYFDFDSRFGPLPLNKDRGARKTPWPRYVWDAVQAFLDQGKVVRDGLCVYELNKKPWKCAFCGKSPRNLMQHGDDYICFRCKAKREA